MKSIFKKSMAVTIVVFMLILTAIPFASAATLIDEQRTVAAYPSYLNSTYFDEIYHARTAFEHLHGLCHAGHLGNTHLSMAAAVLKGTAARIVHHIVDDAAKSLALIVGAVWL